MNGIFINNDRLKSIDFCEMSKNNNKYQYYIEAKRSKESIRDSRYY